MKLEEIRTEFELGIRCLLDARERSLKEGIDGFDELRILEAAFNRLFLAVEHFCNAVVIFETGNYSKKHFGDFERLKIIKEKYSIDFCGVYQETYSFRSFGDYRKFPELEEKFDREHLRKEIVIVNDVIRHCFEVLCGKIDISDIIDKMV